MFIDKFKERFRNLVDVMGKTKNGCAETLGISYQAVVDAYNYGKVPNVRALVRIANYFNVSVDYLLGRTD